MILGYQSQMFSKNQHQLVCELDYSQTQKCFSDDAHVITNFNLNPGGHDHYDRNIIVNEDSISPCDHSNKVKYGDVMLHEFLHTDTPPKGNATMSKHDITDCSKLYDRGMKDLRVKLKERNMISAGNIADTRRRCIKLQPTYCY